MLRRLSLSVALVLCFAITPFVAGDPASPITVSNADSPDPVASGQQLTYTITVVNTAGSKITNVVLADQLNGVGGIGVPPQLVLSSSRGSCSQSTTLVTCNAGTIEGGGSWTVTIRGIVTAANGTTINNTATVSGTHTAQNFTTTTTSTTLVQGGANTPLPDLTISKTGPSSVQSSSPMTYTLTVNNIGTANATGVKVVDTVPTGVTGISATGTSLFVCSVAGQTVTCAGGAVNQGSNATITINGTSPAIATTITNTAAVDPDNTIAEASELNNTSALVNTQVTLATPPGQLTIAVTDGPDPVIPGATLTYNVLVMNSTGQRADDVVIVDGTQGLDAASVQVSQVITNGTLGNTGGCAVNASQTRCTARTLNAGGTIAVTVRGMVLASAGSTIINTGSVTGNIKNAGTSNTATTLTTVRPGVDLTITKADSPDPVCARSWPGTLPTPLVCRGGLTYTFVVGNSGIYPAPAVLVRDPLPAGTIFESYASAPANAHPFTCGVDAANVFACTGDMDPLSTSTITLVLTAPAGVGTITNVVTVDPNNAIFEADETNNTFTQTTQVITGIDLTVKKSDAIDPIATSGTETYTILVNNLGTQDATNIRLRDTLPSGTRFRDVISDHNFTCSYAGGVVECIGGAIKGTASNNDPNVGGPAATPATPPDTATITIRIFAQSFAGTMHNEVRVDPLLEIAEADESNNLATQDTVVDSFVAGHGSFNQLTITKTQLSPDKTNTARNAKVTWQIIVGNNGTDTAVGITVRDFLPAGARYIEATGTNKFNCSQVSGHIDCAGGEIASLATATLTISAFAPDTPGTYVNQAIVDPDNTIPEGDELDNQAFETTVVKNGGLGAFYELSLVKTQTSPLPKTNTARNAIVTYSIVVTNNGTDDVNGVTVRDMMPAGARYISATGDHQFLCTQASNIVNCVGGQVAHGGGTATVTATMFAPDTPGAYINQALVDPDNAIPEGDEFNNASQETTTVANGGAGAFNDLTILKTGTANTFPNGPIQYVLTIGNAGAADALNVTVRDVLPPGVTFLQTTQSGSGGAAFTCNVANQVLNCTGGTVTAGGARIINIDATAPNKVINTPDLPLRNVAVVDPDNTIPEGDEFNNTSAPVDTTVTSKLDLTIRQDGPSSASQSDVTDYTITVQNNATYGGGDIARDVLVEDTLPPGLIVLAITAGSSNNWACEPFENPVNVLRCKGDLNAGGNEGDKVEIKVTVFITAQDGRPLNNKACVDPNNTIPESNELNNCSDLATFISPPIPKSPNLLVSKQVDSVTTTPGADLVYTISVSNSGDAAAKGWDGTEGLTLTDNLPGDVTLTNIEAGPWTCGAPPAIVCHNASDMAPGGSAELKMHVRVKDTAASAIVNTAFANQAIVASSCSDPAGCVNETGANLANNTSTVTSSIGSSGLDLILSTITDVPDPVAPGQPLKYTIIAVNSGTLAVNGVHVKVDVPPTGVTFVSADGSNGFNCGAPSGGSIDCIGDMPGGGNTTITVNFVVLLSGLPPDLTLTATIDPTNAFPNEVDEGNNSKSATTTVSSTGACTACVDLVASELTASSEPVNSGDPLTLKLQIANTGDEAATFIDPQPLLWFDTFSNGTLPVVTPASSDPAIKCFVDASAPGVLETHCSGTLGPGKSATITISFPSVTGTNIVTHGILDPNSLQFESNEFNNFIQQSIVIH